MRAHQEAQRLREVAARSAKARSQKADSEVSTGATTSSKEWLSYLESQKAAMTASLSSAAPSTSNEITVAAVEALQPSACTFKDEATVSDSKTTTDSESVAPLDAPAVPSASVHVDKPSAAESLVLTPLADSEPIQVDSALDSKLDDSDSSSASSDTDSPALIDASEPAGDAIPAENLVAANESSIDSSLHVRQQDVVLDTTVIAAENPSDSPSNGDGWSAGLLDSIAAADTIESQVAAPSEDLSSFVEIMESKLCNDNSSMLTAEVIDSAARRRSGASPTSSISDGLHQLVGNHVDVSIDSDAGAPVDVMDSNCQSDVDALDDDVAPDGGLDDDVLDDVPITTSSASQKQPSRRRVPPKQTSEPAPIASLKPPVPRNRPVRRRGPAATAEDPAYVSVYAAYFPDFRHIFTACASDASAAAPSSGVIDAPLSAKDKRSHVDSTADMATNAVVDACNLISVAATGSGWPLTAPSAAVSDTEALELTAPLAVNHPRFYRVIQNKPEVFRIVTDCLTEVCS